MSPQGLTFIAHENPVMIQRIETLTLASMLDPFSPHKHTIDLSGYTALKTLRLYVNVYTDPGPLNKADHLYHLDRMRPAPSLRTVVTNLPLDIKPFTAFMKQRPDVEFVEDPTGLDF